MMTSSMRSTPIAGMENLLGLIPIEIHIKETAVATMTRLSRTGHWRQPQTKHPHSHTVIHDEVRRKYLNYNFRRTNHGSK